ncbi:MAG: SUF system Fe-S cluster assembly regulator [Myxococcota bacterium]
MIRVSKLADYGIVLMTYAARQPYGMLHTARELARASELPLPTVSKVLKALARGGLLVSQRGTHGGYSLAHTSDAISVADIITAVDGPVSLTQCTELPRSPCDFESVCPVRTNWALINRTVLAAMEKLSLADMAGPLTTVRAGKRRSNVLAIVGSP